MARVTNFPPFQKASSDTDKRVADALEYIAQAMGVQTQIMLEQHASKIAKTRP